MTQVRIHDIEVSAPVRVIQDVPILRRLDINITTRQAIGLRVLFDGLQFMGAEVQLTAKRPVKNLGDAVRWLLDEVANAADEAAD